jgi:amidophosphoribosyltransferase
MLDKFREECGVFGIFNHEEAGYLTYMGLYAQQHRGQESAGIVTSDNTKLRQTVGMGYVKDIFNEEVLARLPGRCAIGHVRYSTAGSVSLLEAQPFLVDGYRGQIAVCHNGNLPYANRDRDALQLQGSIFRSSSDTEIVLHRIVRSKAVTLKAAIIEAFSDLEGAYSMLFLTNDSMFAIRDPRGFRPLCLGQLDDSYVLASETCAFDLIGAKYIREIDPGELVVINQHGLHSSHPFDKVQPAQCIFEHVYFARPDSLVFSQPVNRSRYLMGRYLADEQPADADMVIAIPDSGNAAALGFSDQSGLKNRQGLIRNHYVDRMFIQPKPVMRKVGIKIKLNAIRNLIEGQKVVLVDDSIVRGTTSREIVQMVRDAGAEQIHLRIACPPTIAPCFFGVDTPDSSELIASSHKVEEIRKFVGADSLGYLSRESLLRACGDPHATRHCTSCYTGIYPMDVRIPAMTKARREST